MTQFVDYIVDIAVSLFTYLSSDINEPVTLYMAYGFCLLAVLIVLWFILSLFPKMFFWIYSLFKRGV